MFLKSRWFLILAALALLSLAPTLASAGPNENAKILIHLAATTGKNGCTMVGGIPTCEEIVTAGDLFPHTYFAYLMVTDGDSAAGIAGVQCGIEYANANEVGLDIFNWSLCATLEFPEAGWPESNTGTLITWDSTNGCQRTLPSESTEGVAAVAGYFYCAAYSPDAIRIRTRSSDGQAKVISCDAVEDLLETNVWRHDPTYLGNACFSSGRSLEGFSPCGKTGGIVYQDGCDPDSLTQTPLISGGPAQELGNLEVPEDKYLFVRGQRLTGRLVATYRSGTTYLNDILWQTSSLATIGNDVEIKPPRSLSTNQRQAFQRIPFIAKEMSSGKTIESAMENYLARYQATTRNVKWIYLQSLSGSSYEEAVKRASKMIDRQIANAPDEIEGSSFTPEGSFILKFPGYFQYSFTRLPADDSKPSVGPSSAFTLEIAQARFMELALYMNWPGGSAIAVYSSGGTFLATNEDALRAIADIRSIEETRGVTKVSSNTLLPQEMLREIAARGIIR